MHEKSTGSVRLGGKLNFKKFIFMFILSLFDVRAGRFNILYFTIYLADRRKYSIGQREYRLAAVLESK